MSLMQKRKFLKSIKNIQHNNKEFVSYLDTLQRYPLEELDKTNLDTLKGHLNNMSVVFQGLSESVVNKK